MIHQDDCCFLFSSKELVWFSKVLWTFFVMLFFSDVFWRPFFRFLQLQGFWLRCGWPWHQSCKSPDRPPKGVISPSNLDGYVGFLWCFQCVFFLFFGIQKMCFKHFFPIFLLGCLPNVNSSFVHDFFCTKAASVTGKAAFSSSSKVGAEKAN